MKTVILVGTLDTKGIEYQFARDRFQKAGISTILINAGIIGEPPTSVDVTAIEIALLGGSTLSELRAKNDRGSAVSIMTRGVQEKVRQLRAINQCDGIFALGGSGGSTIAAAAMRDLPIGVPKILVSTLVTSNAAAFIGESDMILFASVVDIAGLNSISSKIITNAIDAMIGILNGAVVNLISTKKLVAASMFGVTTKCVTNARSKLEQLGYEVITFHMTGSGGRSMESLISQGFISGVLDITTTEICDEIVGGSLSAGPNRLTAAGAAGIPQVVSVGALDMVNFGPMASVPNKFQNRKFYAHNENVTLMRTTPEECQKIAMDICAKLSKAKAPVALMIPLRGISAIAVQGEPFYDRSADESLFSTLRKNIPSNVELIEVDFAINDEEFSSACVSKLTQYMEGK